MSVGIDDSPSSGNGEHHRLSGRQEWSDTIIANRGWQRLYSQSIDSGTEVSLPNNRPFVVV